MLAEGFKKERLFVVGFHEGRSKEGGTSQICDYLMTILDPKNQAAGDVEFLFNTVQYGPNIHRPSNKPN